MVLITEKSHIFHLHIREKCKVSRGEVWKEAAWAVSVLYWLNSQCGLLHSDLLHCHYKRIESGSKFLIDSITLGRYHLYMTVFCVSAKFYSIWKIHFFFWEYPHLQKSKSYLKSWSAHHNNIAVTVMHWNM